MKKIDSISVQITYNVRLRNIEVPDDTYKILEHLKTNGSFNVFHSWYGEKEEDAIDWIHDNINELDSYYTEAKITELNG